MAVAILGNVWNAHAVMTDRNTYQNWRIDDIHRFLNAEMSMDEAAQFEQAMQRDPFLKDAVDGFAGHSRIYIDHHLERLHNEFGRQHKRIAMPVWVASAAAVLLLTVTAWFVFRPSSSSFVTAQKEKERTEKGLQPIESPTADNRSIERKDDIGDSDLLQEELSSPAETESAKQESPPTRPRPRRRTPAPTKIEPSGGVVSGTVTDMAGNPLIGASIYFPNNDAAITTDFNGNFAVDLNSLDSKAVVSYTGYDSDVFNLRKNGKQIFQLSEGVVLEEVAVTSMGVESMQEPEVLDDGITTDQADQQVEALSVEREVTNSVLEATPERGYRKYDRYIKRNLNYPALARANKIEGEVIVQFKVLPGGELFDFRILQSVGAGCDEEAIRLVKDGPAWVVGGANQIGQATYTVVFEL